MVWEWEVEAGGGSRLLEWLEGGSRVAQEWLEGGLRAEGGGAEGWPEGWLEFRD